MTIRIYRGNYSERLPDHKQKVEDVVRRRKLLVKMLTLEPGTREAVFWRWFGEGDESVSKIKSTLARLNQLSDEQFEAAGFFLLLPEGDPLAGKAFPFELIARLNAARQLVAEYEAMDPNQRKGCAMAVAKAWRRFECFPEFAQIAAADKAVEKDGSGRTTYWVREETVFAIDDQKVVKAISEGKIRAWADLRNLLRGTELISDRKVELMESMEEMIGKLKAKSA